MDAQGLNSLEETLRIWKYLCKPSPVALSRVCIIYNLYITNIQLYIHIHIHKLYIYIYIYIYIYTCIYSYSVIPYGYISNFLLYKYENFDETKHQLKAPFFPRRQFPSIPHHHRLIQAAIQSHRFGPCPANLEHPALVKCKRPDWVGY